MLVSEGMKNLLVGTCALALCGIGLVLAETSTDYNHRTDFAQYKTYSWLKAEAGDPLWSDRIPRAVDEQLSAKGMTMQTSGGSLAVAALGRRTQQQSYTTFYDNIGGGWGWRGFGGMGMGTSQTTVQETPIGTLTVDLFDASSKQLVWRGTSSESLSNKPEKNEKKLEHDVAELFKKFPPKGDR